MLFQTPLSVEGRGVPEEKAGGSEPDPSSPLRCRIPAATSETLLLTLSLDSEMNGTAAAEVSCKMLAFSSRNRLRKHFNYGVILFFPSNMFQKQASIKGHHLLGCDLPPPTCGVDVRGTVSIFMLSLSIITYILFLSRCHADVTVLAAGILQEVSGSSTD